MLSHLTLFTWKLAWPETNKCAAIYHLELTFWNFVARTILDLQYLPHKSNILFMQNFHYCHQIMFSCNIESMRVIHCDNRIALCVTKEYKYHGYQLHPGPKLSSKPLGRFNFSSSMEPKPIEVFGASLQGYVLALPLILLTGLLTYLDTTTTNAFQTSWLDAMAKNLQSTALSFFVTPITSKGSWQGRGR